MEQMINDQKNFPAFTDEQREDVIEIIGDTLYEALSQDEELHYADLFQAAVDICTILSGSTVFCAINFELWRVTHAQKYEEVRKKAEKNGLKVSQQIFDDILSKVGKYFGITYPPFELN